MPQKPDKEIGAAPVAFTGNALYLTMGGGTFTHLGVKGQFSVTSDGSAIVIYITDGGAYECGVEGVIEAAVKHHKANR